jgi:hypothetical protein
MTATALGGGMLAVPAPYEGMTPEQLDTLNALVQLVNTKANQQYVVDQIAAVVGAAPAALDTLAEIAAQLGNDESAITALTNAVAGALRFDVAQSLTTPQKTQALDNLGVAAVGRTGSFNDLGDKASLLDTLLAGLSTAVSTAVLATDSIKTAIGKLQGQVSSNQAAIPLVNIFPNPDLTAAGTTLYSAVPSIDGNDPVLDMSGSGTKLTYYDVSASGLFAVGQTLNLTVMAFCDVSGNGVSADITISYLNSSGASVGSATQINVLTAGSYVALSATSTVPAGAAVVRLRFVKRSAAAVAKFKNVVLLNTTASQKTYPAPSVQKSSTFYVATTGSDANSGSIAAPFLTLSRAVAAALPRGKIIVRGGDYTAGAAITGAEKLEICAYQGERVRFLLGTKLTGITKTAGQTKVHQAAMAAKPARWLWEHDMPDATTLISDADRHPIQRGRQYRLPSARISEVASIAAIDAAANPSWYWAGGIIYFSITGGGSALASSIYLPYGNGVVWGGTGIESIRIDNITGAYSGIRLFDVRNLLSWEGNNCLALGGSSNGFARDDTRFSIERFCEAAGNATDGFNMHRYGINPNHEQVPSVSYNNWSHDNDDDGDSYHEDCIGVYYGGLYEYNGDRGIATAYGAHTTAYNTIARYNGQVDPSGGEGFAAVGSVTPADDNGVGTQMDCYNCQSYNNLHNYRTSNATAKMTIVSSKSANAVTSAFTNTAGTMLLKDCGDVGSSTVKTGSITVQNTTLVA